MCFIRAGGGNDRTMEAHAAPAQALADARPAWGGDCHRRDSGNDRRRGSCLGGRRRYAVDTSEVSTEGSCKIENWLSAASNKDLIGVANPSCVVNLGRPVELSAQTYRFRADDEWGTGITPKAKTKIVPSAIGSFGLAISGTLVYDLITQENTAIFVTFRPRYGSRRSCAST